MTQPKKGYIHGTHPEEQQRLSTLNTLLNDRSLERMKLSGGERILDVGSGLGQLSRGMARLAGSPGLVVGIEQSSEQIAEAERQSATAGEEGLVEFRRGDAVALPLADEEWGMFDIAHARFLLEHVPDAQAVVNAMAKAVRPGGRIILEDDDHDVLRLWPAVAGFEKLWRAYIRTYTEHGFDPYVGRSLVGILVEAGVVPIRNDWPFFGGCAGSPMFRELVDNFVGIVDGARGTILKLTQLDDATFDGHLRAFSAWGQRPDAAMWYGTFWAEGERPHE